MALPSLDATFASLADLPRKQMLAKWLVEELGSGSIADYYDLPERYLWAKIAVAAGAPKTEADYISLPKNYVWSDIYNAVAGSSGSHIDWTEKQALGHIAAAYRGDTENPEALATYIDWPWRYQVTAIIEAATAIDPYFSNVSLLMHMDGINGSQSFIDSSSNAFSITVGGEVNISTSEKKIGTGSAYFDGNADYLELPIDEAFNFGSNDFTIECWFNVVTDALFTLIASWSGGVNAFYIGGDASEEIKKIQFYANGSLFIDTETDSIQSNQWIHIAIVRSSNIIKMYINGSEVGAPYDATDIAIDNIALPPRIGWDNAGNAVMNGYIDEVRITKGVARYTSNFTPQLEPFPNQ